MRVVIDIFAGFGMGFAVYLLYCALVWWANSDLL